MSLHLRSPRIVGSGHGTARRRRRTATTPPPVVACLRCAAERAGAAATAAATGTATGTPPRPHRPRIVAAISPPSRARPPQFLLAAAAPPGQEESLSSHGVDDDEAPSIGNENENERDEDGAADDPSLDVGARAALAFLRFYREGLSPLLQPACRYQPTCSRYAIASYRAYGGWRGSVLITWRLMRCAPWGRGGFDPPRWPPPGLGLVFQYDAAAPVAVVLVVSGLVRLTHALLFE